MVVRTEWALLFLSPSPFCDIRKGARRSPRDDMNPCAAAVAGDRAENGGAAEGAAPRRRGRARIDTPVGLGLPVLSSPIPVQGRT